MFTMSADSPSMSHGEDYLWSCVSGPALCSSTYTYATLHPQVDKGAWHHCSPLPFLQSDLLLQRPRYNQRFLLSSGAAEVCGLLVHQQQRTSARGTYLCTRVCCVVCRCIVSSMPDPPCTGSHKGCTVWGKTWRMSLHVSPSDAWHRTCHPVMYGIALVTPWCKMSWYQPTSSVCLTNVSD